MSGEVPPQQPTVAAGDGSTSLWGGTFLPLGQGPKSATPLPGWAENYDLLLAADPARFFTLDYLIWTLNFAVGQALCAAGEANSCPMGGSAVNSVALVDPEPYMATDGAQFRFPLLALWRKKSRSAYISTVYPYREGTWKLRYVLPAMGFETATRIEPIFQAVEEAIDNACHQGYHPQYAPPGGVAGALVFAASGMMEIETGDATWDEYVSDEGGGIVHLVFEMELLVKVRKMDVRTPAGSQVQTRGAPVPLGGVDAQLSVAAEGGDANPVPIVQVRSDVPTQP